MIRIIKSLMLVSGVAALLGVLLIYLSVFHKNQFSQSGKFIPDGPDCRLPLTYRLGSFDQAFGISEGDFTKAMREAENVWEKPLNLNIFELDESGNLKVNLVFDERQAETKRIKEILSEIGTDEEKYNAIKAEYEKLKAQLEKREAEYQKDLSNYEKEQNKIKKSAETYEKHAQSYEQKVSYWSSRGGAPEDEYDKLAKEKKELELLYNQLKKDEDRLRQQHDSLEQEREKINGLVGEVNTLAGILNRLAARVNLKAGDLNQIQQSREEFMTGLYKSDQSGSVIDVYQFFDEKDLILILAHEFGHSLGLDHARNLQSIMYPQLGQQNVGLTEEDLKMFREKCSP
ncbi:MAG: matrixin family metalloprotease [Candidatus Moranbacteria bacterium]|nr:matrixin family metalloprotease [Candidatus Moranbacteria bacterium]